MGRAGIKTIENSREKQGVAEKTAAKSAAVSAEMAEDVRELAAFLVKLPVKMREALLAMANAAKNDRFP
jgi:hypothetical protein